jgi:hypothetical protein
MVPYLVLEHPKYRSASHIAQAYRVGGAVRQRAAIRQDRRMTARCESVRMPALGPALPIEPPALRCGEEGTPGGGRELKRQPFAVLLGVADADDELG